MARFILDIADLTVDEADHFMEQMVENNGDKILRITVIDYSNDGQFNDYIENDIITERQLENYSLSLN